MHEDREESRGGLAVAVVCGALLAILLLACGGGGAFYIYTLRQAQQRALEQALRAEAEARLAAEQARAAVAAAELSKAAEAAAQRQTPKKSDD